MPLILGCWRWQHFSWQLHLNATAERLTSLDMCFTHPCLATPPPPNKTGDSATVSTLQWNSPRRPRAHVLLAVSADGERRFHVYDELNSNLPLFDIEAVVWLRNLQELPDEITSNHKWTLKNQDFWQKFWYFGKSFPVWLIDKICFVL